MRVAGFGRSIFWEDGSLYIGSSIAPSQMHSHHAIQLSLGLEGEVEFRRSSTDRWVGYPAAVIPPDLPHTSQAPGRLLAHVFCQPESLVGRRVLARFSRHDVAALPAAEAQALQARCRGLPAQCTGAGVGRDGPADLPQPGGRCTPRARPRCKDQACPCRDRAPAGCLPHAPAVVGTIRSLRGSVSPPLRRPGRRAVPCLHPVGVAQSCARARLFGRVLDSGRARGRLCRFRSSHQNLPRHVRRSSDLDRKRRQARRQCPVALDALERSLGIGCSSI